MSVGQSPLRHDAAAKTDGSIEYAGDAVPAGALHAVVVFSGRAHARMLSMSTDVALAVPGVVDIITAADAPVNEYGLTMRDQPALVGVDHTGAAAVDAAIEVPAKGKRVASMAWNRRQVEAPRGTPGAA